MSALAIWMTAFLGNYGAASSAGVLAANAFSNSSTRSGSSWVAASGAALTTLASTSATAATAPSGSVVAWGFNTYYQLGDGTRNSSTAPVQVSGLTNGATGITAGNYHSMALKSDGSVVSWGDNFHGQLGDGTTNSSSTPVQVTGLTGVTSLATGAYHSMALKSDGSVVAWGFNGQGQLGDGTTTDRTIPTPVTGLSSGVTAIAAGFGRSIALRSDGSVVAWGAGLLGNGTYSSSTTPVQVTDLTSGVVAIATGGDHSMALKSDGSVVAWGYNAQGQLGDGTTNSSSTPVQVTGLTSGGTAIAAGAYHSLVRKADGSVVAWGYNAHGQLGDGTTNSSSIPVQVTGLTGGAATLAAGFYHSMALKGDGSVVAWGQNVNGQLGDGTTNSSSTPIQVLGLTGGVRAIAVGHFHSMAIKSDPVGTPCPTVATTRAPAPLGSEFMGMYRLGNDPTTTPPVVAPTNGPPLDKNNPGPFEKLGGVYASILNCAPSMPSNPGTSAWVNLQQLGNGNAFIQVGWIENPDGKSFRTLVQLSDRFSEPGYEDCGIAASRRFLECLDAYYALPPPPIGASTYYTIEFHPGERCASPDPTTDDWFCVSVDGVLVAQAPAHFLPNQANVMGEIHDAASQMPGTELSPEVFNDVHVFNRDGSGWVNFHGARAYNSVNVAPLPARESWFGIDFTPPSGPNDPSGQTITIWDRNAPTVP